MWQNVLLRATGDVRIGDPHVRTLLPKPDNSLAELTISVPVTNDSGMEREIALEARFGDVTLRQSATLAPNSATTLRFAPEQFADCLLYTSWRSRPVWNQTR